MADAATASPDLDAAYAELDAVVASIETKNGEIEQLYERRRKAFQRLLDLGVAQAAIARRVGLSPMAIAFSVNPEKGRNGKKGKRRSA